jgi:PAS domain-containing protein
LPRNPAPAPACSVRSRPESAARGARRAPWITLACARDDVPSGPPVSLAERGGPLARSGIGSPIMRDEESSRPAPDERRLLSQHASQEAILDALLPAQAAVYVKDRDGRYLLVNATGAANLGYAPEDLVGRTDIEVFSHSHVRPGPDGRGRPQAGEGARHCAADADPQRDRGQHAVATRRTDQESPRPVDTRDDFHTDSANLPQPPEVVAHAQGVRSRCRRHALLVSAESSSAAVAAPSLPRASADARLVGGT